MSSNANLDSTQQNTDGNWVVHIWHTLSVTEADLENPRVVCVCVVPESLRCSKWEAFIPQFVGLGPYHHFRTDLIMTQQKKLASAKRVLKDLLPSDMNQFQQQISNLGLEVQTLYHPDVKSTYKYNDHTLSFLFTVDGLFLLAFITSSGEPDAEFSNFLTGNLRMLLFNAAGVELTKNVLIREVFMLENQIPFHVLEKISGKKIIQSESNGHEGFGSNVVNFCKLHCPVLVKSEVFPNNTVHLLDLMYHFIVPRPQSPPQPHEPEEAQQNPVPEPQPATEPNHEPQSGPAFVNFFENMGRGFSGSWQSQILTIPAAFIFVIPLIVVDLVYLIVLKPFWPEPEPEPQPAEPEHQYQQEPEKEPESQPSESEPEPESQPEPEPQPETFEFQFGSWKILAYIILGEFILPAYFIYLILKLFWWVISSIILTIKRVLSYLFGLVKRAFRRSIFNSAFGWLHDALSNMEGRVYNPLLRPLKEAVAHLKVMTEERQTRDSDEGAPLADQRIPSAMLLHNAGIFFKPVESGISSIDFDDENCVFYLPSIRLDVNSEVIIRNLLAYETLIKSNHPLVFTRYVELMRAIIDTPADVKILVDSEIIKTELWSEKVAELFKGMSKSIRPTMTPDLDKVIHNVKAKFDTTQKRINWDVIKHMSGTFFTILGCLLFLFFTGLQTYCSVVNCSGTLKHVKLPKYGESYGRNNYFISSM